MRQDYFALDILSQRRLALFRICGKGDDMCDRFGDGIGM